MPSYITEADLYRYAPEAQRLLNSDRSIYGWGAAVSSVYPAYQTGSISVLKRDGEDLGAPQANVGAVDADGKWFYDSDEDKLSLFSTANPSDSDMEASEDFATYFVAIAAKASRLLDSRVDISHQTPFAKDKSGNFDEVVIQATAYMLGTILTNGRDEDLYNMYTNRLYNEDDTGIVDGINSGAIKLATEISVDSKSGSIREVAVAGDVHLTRSRGAFSGNGHDRVKIIISTAGAAGTAIYKVFGYDPDTDTPKSLQWGNDDGEKVEFYQWQGIGNGLEIMFEGDASAEATENDEWELEVHGEQAQVTNTSFKSIPLTRGC